MKFGHWRKGQKGVPTPRLWKPMDHFQLWFLLFWLSLNCSRSPERRRRRRLQQNSPKLPRPYHRNLLRTADSQSQTSGQYYVESMLQSKHYILLFVEVFQVEVDENISVCYVYSGSSVIISVCLFVLEHIKTSAWWSNNRHSSLFVSGSGL